MLGFSRPVRAFQDEEQVEAEVVEAWATFATGGEVQHLPWDLPKLSELDVQELASWPKFNPSNSSVMVLGSDEVWHLISTMMMKLCQLTSSASPESVLLWKSLVWQPLIQTIQVGWGGGDETNDDCNLYHDHNRDTGEEEEVGVQETF